jgi:hypothetical protein
MLKKMIGQLDNMLSHHSKVFLVRFDLQQLTYTATNKLLTVFNRRLHKWVKRRYKTKDVGFIWCREAGAPVLHYHYVLMVDGQKVNTSYSILARAKQIWADMGGNFWRPENCYYNLTLGNMATRQKAVYRISYLAKVRSKGERPPQTKDYGTSRIKYNPKRPKSPP